MAGQWVDDPSWGNVFDGFFQSGGKAGQIQLTAEHIKALQLKRAMDQEKLQGIRALIDRQNAQFNAMTPGPTDIPMPPDIALPQFNAAGAPMGPATVTPADPLRLENIPRSWGVDEGFYRDREALRARSNLAPYMATGAGDLLKSGTAGDAVTRLGLYGIPQDQRAKDVMQTQLSAEDIKMPGYGTQPAVHNWVDPASGQQGRTTNGMTDLTTGKPLPPGATMAGAADLTPKSPFGTAEAAKAELATGALARKIQSGAHLTTNETEQLGILLDTAYPEKLVSADEGGRRVTRSVREQVIPPEHQRLVDLVNAYRSGAHLQPQQPPPLAGGGAVPFLPPDAVPTVGAGAPPATPPIVPPPQRRQMGNAPSEPVSTGPIAAQQIADNLRSEPIYKTYTTVLQAWNTLARYAEGGYDGKTYDNGTDLAIIYHIAKLFDPDSAVREGELQLTQNIGPIGDQLMAAYRRMFLDGGILPANARAQLLHAGQRKMEEVGEVANSIFDTYRTRAGRGGVDPADIVPDLPAPKPMDYRAVVEKGKETERRGQQPTSTPPVIDQPAVDPAQQERVRRQLGIP